MAVIRRHTHINSLQVLGNKYLHTAILFLLLFFYMDVLMV